MCDLYSRACGNSMKISRARKSVCSNGQFYGFVAIVETAIKMDLEELVGQKVMWGYSREAEVVSCTSVSAGGVEAGSNFCGARQ